MKYRERFGITPQELDQIPMKDVLRDLEMLSIEAEMTKPPEEISQ